MSLSGGLHLDCFYLQRGKRVLLQPFIQQSIQTFLLAWCFSQCHVCCRWCSEVHWTEWINYNLLFLLAKLHSLAKFLVDKKVFQPFFMVLLCFVYEYLWIHFVWSNIKTDVPWPSETSTVKCFLALNSKHNNLIENLWSEASLHLTCGPVHHLSG